MWGDVLNSQELQARKRSKLGRSVSKETMAKIDVLEETIGKKLEYVTYKLEFEQIRSSFGVPMSYDLIVSMLVVCGSIMVTLT
mmetsp:Transcript_23858/g.36529  ORF Transcript_23858/g.36529 Transcript_23858/m.36529 type:complete len:83 (+) Transcript_23858:186-434(+)